MLASSVPVSVSPFVLFANDLLAAKSAWISANRTRANSMSKSPISGCIPTSISMSSLDRVHSWHWRMAVVVYGRTSDRPARQMTPKKSPPFIGDESSSVPSTVSRTIPLLMTNILSARSPSTVKASPVVAWYALSSRHTSARVRSVRAWNKGTLRITPPYM